MFFKPTSLTGAYLIELDKKADERGFFARAFCEQEFGQHGLMTHVCQVNNSLSTHRGHPSWHALSARTQGRD